MSNWNWMLKGLVKEYDGVDGLKTGSTPEAGDCFTGTVERNGMRFISVVIKTSSHTARFDETKKLYDYGFANFEMKQMYKKRFFSKRTRNSTSRKCERQRCSSSNETSHFTSSTKRK